MATAAPNPAPAAQSIVPPRLPAGEYTGYFDNACVLEDGNNFPIVNGCHALLDNSIVVLNEACGVVELFTDDNCLDDAQTVALGVCTDTSFYNSLKVVCQ
ncbi:hypothetical protein MMC06_001487 [Schaereria dolodes]|nr:hypothetical protein [Schaereria dolodes]